LATHSPAPVRDFGAEQRPDRFPQRAGHVRGGRVDGDHKLELIDDDGEVAEIAEQRIEIADGYLRGEIRKILGPLAFLQAEKLDSGCAKKRQKLVYIAGTLPVGAIDRAACPDDTDFKLRGSFQCQRGIVFTP